MRSIRDRSNCDNLIYPDWSKNLYPHLFRHSRLTELAATQLNEPQLRKFAGWSGDSDMPKIYFHLDDTDLRNILIQENGQKPIEKKKPKTFKPIICKVCKAENTQQNAFCYKCGNVINKDRIVVDRVKEKVDIEKLKRDNKELNKKVDKLEEIASKIPNLLEAYENMKKLLSENLNNISDKEIIKTLGLKEIPKELTKKLNVKPSKLTKLEEKY